MVYIQRLLIEEYPSSGTDQYFLSKRNTDTLKPQTPLRNKSFRPQASKCWPPSTEAAISGFLFTPTLGSFKTAKTRNWKLSKFCAHLKSDFMGPEF